MNTFILLGGNIGNTIQYCQKVKGMMKKYDLQIIRCSQYYTSEAWGFKTSTAFINQVLQIETHLSPPELLSQCLQIESDAGRVRHATQGYESRIMDIDILLYGDTIIHNQDLMIPHPRLHLRRFTLLPLSEIAPHVVHPVLQKTIQTLLHECQDSSFVQKVTNIS